MPLAVISTARDPRRWLAQAGNWSRYLPSALRTSSSWPAEPSLWFLGAMNLAYSSMKILPGGRKSNSLGLVAEELAVHARPDQAAVGVDVDLGDAELGGGQIFVRVDAHRARRSCRRRR